MRLGHKNVLKIERFRAMGSSHALPSQPFPTYRTVKKYSHCWKHILSRQSSRTSGLTKILCEGLTESDALLRSGRFYRILSQNSVEPLLVEQTANRTSPGFLLPTFP
ncbi:hypothetical protein CHARACLAT_010246 [Characodon lateralis]|uniref:Uncharacterized protein n=1 Tax=Characodon lateralis TaxID=208331 RepID=A0ABU7F1S3_9TELE|nr:hypothetical protein [Characodon lateralis]